MGGIKEWKLFPLVWGLRFFLLAAAQAAAAGAGGRRRGRAGAGAGRRQRGRRASPSALREKASPAAAGRQRRAVGRRMETSRFKFLRCTASSPWKQACCYYLLLLLWCGNSLSGNPVTVLLQETDSKCQRDQTMPLRPYLECKVLHLETSEYFPYQYSLKKIQCTSPMSRNPFSEIRTSQDSGGTALGGCSRLSCGAEHFSHPGRTWYPTPSMGHLRVLGTTLLVNCV